MKAIILAAGVASRMRPLTDDAPKCLLPVGKKSILERTIDNLMINGINELIIVTGYLEQMIRDFVADHYPSLRVNFIYNEKYETTNNVYSLWLARHLISGSDIILMDSDIIFDQRIVALLMHPQGMNRLAVRFEDNLGEEEMKVLVSKDQRIMQISKQIDPQKAAGESMGMAKFDGEFVRVLLNIIENRIVDRGLVNDFYEAAFQEALEEGYELYAVDILNYRCVELDTVEDMAYAREVVVAELDP